MEFHRFGDFVDKKKKTEKRKKNESKRDTE